jgi:16S rRNA (guanine1516-N2)-methyltransferase
LIIYFKNMAKIAFCLCDGYSGTTKMDLAQGLNLPVFAGPELVPACYTHLLCAAAEGLSLGLRGPDAPGATRVDFLDPVLQHRLRTSGKRQGLGKAVGLEKAAGIRVLDATAGLGRDALVLAHLGCDVTLLEREPLLHVLLEDGIARALAEPSLAATARRLRLLRADARDYFAAIAGGEVPAPEVIYLDPMFPARDKTAKVKKDMALLQALLGPEDDLAGLLDAARACALRRVVLKRPGSKTLAGLPRPTFVVAGKAAHFDVYVNSSFSSTPR